MPSEGDVAMPAQCLLPGSETAKGTAKNAAMHRQGQVQDLRCWAGGRESGPADLCETDMLYLDAAVALAKERCERSMPNGGHAPYDRDHTLSARRT